MPTTDQQEAPMTRTTLSPATARVGVRVHTRQRGQEITGHISATYDPASSKAGMVEITYPHPDAGNGTVRLGHTVRIDAYAVHCTDVAAAATYLQAHASRSPVDGAWRWHSNGSCVPDDYLASCDAPAAERQLTQEASRCELAQLAARYRAAQAAQPSSEELAEMRAAFGSGTTVVDVISGRTVQL